MTQATVAFEAGAQRVLVANEVVSLADARVIVDALATRPSAGRTRPSTGVPEPRRARPRISRPIPTRTAGASFIAWSTRWPGSSYSTATLVEQAWTTG